MAVCGDASTWVKFGFLLMIFGFAIFIGGFVSDFWMTSESVREQIDLSVGLWNMKNCSGSTGCMASPVYSGYINAIFQSTMYIECGLLALYFAALIMYGVYMALHNARTRCLAISTILMIVILVVLEFVCMGLWLIQIPAEFFPSYSLGIILFAIFLALIAATFLFKEIKANNFYAIKVANPSPVPERRVTETAFSPSPQATPRSKPRHWTKQPISPSPPTTPSTITKFMFEDAAGKPKARSPPPSYRSTPRRYGTPSFVNRYDSKAR